MAKSQPSDPVAHLSVPPTAKVGEVVVIDASASYDPGGFIKSAQINMGDGVTVSFGAKQLRPHPHTYWEAGSKVITVSIVDNHKHSSSAQATINIEGVIEEPPQDTTAPAVAIDFDHATGTGTVTAIDADAVLSAEVSADGVLVAGGPVPLTFQLTDAQRQPGAHIIEATVVDSSLNVGSASVEFTVQEPVPEPVDCVLSAESVTPGTWGPWLQVDGKTEVRHRQDTWTKTVLVQPAHGGAPCGETSGTRTATETRPVVQPPPPPPEDDKIAHPYFYELATRPDCAFSYSLRDAAQVDRLRNQPSANMAYVYPTDPDPRRQDAAKITIPEGSMGPGVELRMLAGPTGAQSFLLTFDQWWGNEFNAAYSKLDLHKECPLALNFGQDKTVVMRTDYSAATKVLATQPEGGPFVAMCYPQVSGKGPSVKTPGTWMDTMTGFPRVRMPAGVPSDQTRGYAECLATAINGPLAAECGVVAERWTRFWHYYERAPDEDFVNIQGEPRLAYRYSMWYADRLRGAILVSDQAVVGIPTTQTEGAKAMALHMGAGGSNEPSRYLGRGDLIGYSRNWVVLLGTSKADVPALLVKPVN